MEKLERYSKHQTVKGDALRECVSQWISSITHPYSTVGATWVGRELPTTWEELQTSRSLPLSTRDFVRTFRHSLRHGSNVFRTRTIYYETAPAATVWSTTGGAGGDEPLRLVVYCGNQILQRMDCFGTVATFTSTDFIAMINGIDYERSNPEVPTLPPTAPRGLLDLFAVAFPPVGGRISFSYGSATYTLYPQFETDYLESWSVYRVSPCVQYGLFRGDYAIAAFIGTIDKNDQPQHVDPPTLAYNWRFATRTVRFETSVGYAVFELMAASLIREVRDHQHHYSFGVDGHGNVTFIYQTHTGVLLIRERQRVFIPDSRVKSARKGPFFKK